MNSNRYGRSGPVGRRGPLGAYKRLVTSLLGVLTVAFVLTNLAVGHLLSQLIVTGDYLWVAGRVASAAIGFDVIAPLVHQIPAFFVTRLTGPLIASMLVGAGVLSMGLWWRAR